LADDGAVASYTYAGMNVQTPTGAASRSRRRATDPAGGPLVKKITLRDLEAARQARRALPMLTCYDFTTATVMQQAGIPLLLVGDTAAVVILGHESTVHIRQPILQELTAAVRRGAPLAYLVADMPFGSYHADEGQAIENVCEMVRATGCDAVKLEVTQRQAGLVQRLADAGVAIWAHLGLRPQSAQRMGYRTQGRAAAEAHQIVADARQMVQSGAAAILLEAIPPEVGQAVVEAVEVPVIGCGAGPAPMGHVVVLQDLLGQTPHRPRFVPEFAGELSLQQAVEQYAKMVVSGSYPGREHCYEMAPGESEQFLKEARRPREV
jgi:3-methyl-2-oxobutanoate hydroxymethyltransferase